MSSSESSSLSSSESASLSSSESSSLSSSESASLSSSESASLSSSESASLSSSISTSNSGSLIYETKYLYRDITVHFPNGSTSLIEQTVTYQRSAVIEEPQSGIQVNSIMMLDISNNTSSIQADDIQWSSWEPIDGDGIFEAYTAPKIPGYIANIPYVVAETADSNLPDGTVIKRITIYYTATSGSGSGRTSDSISESSSLISSESASFSLSESSSLSSSESSSLSSSESASLSLSESSSLSSSESSSLSSSESASLNSSASSSFNSSESSSLSSLNDKLVSLQNIGTIGDKSISPEQISNPQKSVLTNRNANSVKRLPQTGNENDNYGMIGALTAVVATMLGFVKKHRHEDE